MSFRLVPKSVTLNDLERRNGVIYGRPMEWGRPYIFSCCGLFFFLLLFFPRLMSAAADWMSAILPHMVWP